MFSRVACRLVDERLVAVKTATEAASRERLYREAAVLGRLEHPGVVRLVSYTPGATCDELVTEFAGPTTVEVWRPPSAAALALLGAELAGIVAELHERGLSHGQLGPSHVIVDSANHPVLCSFADATVNAAPGERAADVRALGGLLLVSLGQMRATRRQARRCDRSAEVHVVAEVAAAATGADEHGPSASDLAVWLATGIRGIASAQPLLSGPTVATGEPSQRGTPRAGTRRSLLVAAAALTALVGGIGLGQHERRRGTVPVVVAPGPCERAPVGGATSVDLDGNGCPETPVTADGSRLLLGPDWFTTHDDADRFAAGDWDCDGTTTVVALRAADGALFVLAPGPVRPQWRLAEQHPGALLEVVESPGGCPSLLAAFPDGTSPIRLEP
jgi:hypothetical protein